MKQIKFTLPVKPRTKKNHSQLVTLKTGRQMLLPAKAYKEFEKAVVTFCKKELSHIPQITETINLKAVFYKDKDYKSDLVGYLQALQDSLVKAGILYDDNSRIIRTTNGSEVLLDRENPRIEVTITFYEELNTNEQDYKDNYKVA